MYGDHEYRQYSGKYEKKSFSLYIRDTNIAGFSGKICFIMFWLSQLVTYREVKLSRHIRVRLRGQNNSKSDQNYSSKLDDKSDSKKRSKNDQKTGQF